MRHGVRVRGGGGSLLPGVDVAGCEREALVGVEAALEERERAGLGAADDALGVGG
jgi:hypothetical protein